MATFGLNFQIFNALMATKEFGKGPASFGLLGTFIAFGSFSGAHCICTLGTLSKDPLCY